MGKGLEQTFLQTIYTNGREEHEKMLDLTKCSSEYLLLIPNLKLEYLSYKSWFSDNDVLLFDLSFNALYSFCLLHIFLSLQLDYKHILKNLFPTSFMLSTASFFPSYIYKCTTLFLCFIVISLNLEIHFLLLPFEHLSQFSLLKLDLLKKLLSYNEKSHYFAIFFLTSLPKVVWRGCSPEKKNCDYYVQLPKTE